MYTGYQRQKVETYTLIMVTFKVFYKGKALIIALFKPLQVLF